MPLSRRMPHSWAGWIGACRMGERWCGFVIWAWTACSLTRHSLLARSPAIPPLPRRSPLFQQRNPGFLELLKTVAKAEE